FSLFSWHLTSFISLLSSIFLLLLSPFFLILSSLSLCSLLLSLPISVLLYLLLVHLSLSISLAPSFICFADIWPFLQADYQFIFLYFLTFSLFVLSHSSDLFYCCVCQNKILSFIGCKFYDSN